MSSAQPLQQFIDEVLVRRKFSKDLDYWHERGIHYQDPKPTIKEGLAPIETNEGAAQLLADKFFSLKSLGDINNFFPFLASSTIKPESMSIYPTLLKVIQNPQFEAKGGNEFLRNVLKIRIDLSIELLTSIFISSRERELQKIILEKGFKFKKTDFVSKDSFYSNRAWQTYKILTDDISDLEFKPIIPVNFFQDVSMAGSTESSPTQVLNVFSAVKGSAAFQSQTPLNAEPLKKTLFLTPETRGDFEEPMAWMIPLISLVQRGFRVVYQHAEKGIQEITWPLTRETFDDLWSGALIWDEKESIPDLLKVFPHLSADQIHQVTHEDLKALQEGLSQEKEVRSSKGFLLQRIGVFCHFSDGDITGKESFSAYLRVQKAFRSVCREASTFEKLKSSWGRTNLSALNNWDFDQELKSFLELTQKYPLRSKAVALVIRAKESWFYEARSKDFGESLLAVGVDRNHIFSLKIILHDCLFYSSPENMVERNREYSKIAVLIQNLASAFPNVVHMEYGNAPIFEACLKEIQGQKDSPIKHWHCTSFVQLDGLNKPFRTGPSIHGAFGGSSGTIHTHIGALSDTLSTTARSRPAHFLMGKTGEWIEGQQCSEVRDGLIAFRREGQEVKLQLVFETDGASLNVDDQIQGRESSIYQFLLKTSLSPGEVVRLYSLSSSERIKFEKDLPPGVRAFRGSDDFFYVKNTSSQTQSLDLSYQLGVKKLESSSSLTVKKVLWNLIQDYKDESKGFKPAVPSDSPLPAFVSWGQFQQECFSKRAGTCAIRTWCVYEEIKKRNPDLLNQVRVVRINRNHVRLEICSNQGSWIPVDLGGGTATLTYLPEMPKAAVFQSTAMAFGASSLGTSVKSSGRLGWFDWKPLKAWDLSEVSVKPVLVNVSKDSQAWKTLEQIRAKNPRIFYVDSPEWLCLGEPRLVIQEAKLIHQLGGELAGFLNAARRNPTEDFVLVIDWRKLSAKARGQLNEVLAKDPEKRTLQGMKLPVNVRVVSFADYGREIDGSFLSRHDCRATPEESGTAESKAGAGDSSSGRVIVIDVQGKLSWEAELFGSVELIGSQVKWKPAEWLEAIKGGEHVQMTLKNLTPEDEQAVREWIDRSKALGSYAYHGFEIPADRLEVVVELSDLRFEDFKPVPVKRSQTWSSVDSPASVVVVNSALFDRLLKEAVTTESGEYVEQEGVLSQHKGRSLSLFVTAPLSDSQWYALFDTAKHFRVSLNLSLAASVELPPKMKAERVESSASESTSASSEIKIFLAEDTEAALSVLPTRTEGETLYIIDVEDFDYGQLIESRDCRVLGEEGMESEVAVSVHPSDIKKALDRGEQVLLKGAFSSLLLQTLEPLLIQYPNLILLVEVGSKQTTDSRLSHWGDRVRYVETPEKNLAPVILKGENPEYLKTLSAEDFIRERKESVIEALSENPAVSLIGPPAVGKSSLMREFEETGGLKVYRELSTCQAWAEDRSEGLKVLFIDENNLENRHLTEFASLIRGERPASILINGKRVELTDQHRVVFARNPESAGGARVKQKLFSHFSIPEIHLSSFAPAYVRERLIEPILGHLKDSVPASDMEKWVEEVQRTGQIRRVQEAVLRWVSEQSSRPLPVLPATPDFFETSNLKGAVQTLQRFIDIRQHQTPEQQGSGLGGIFIEGRPGMGKTEMIRACLLVSQYEIHTPEEKFEDGDQPICVKLDAALSWEKKKEALIQAFDQGWAVWMDEFDTCLAGAEKFWNALLTGRHPETGQPAKHPGFLLLATGNSRALEGREALSDALRDRLETVVLPDYRFEDLIELLRHYYPTLPEAAQKKIVSEFLTQQKTQPALNLRAFMETVRKEPKDFPKEMIEKTEPIQHIPPSPHIPMSVSPHSYCAPTEGFLKTLEDYVNAQEQRWSLWGSNKKDNIIAACALHESVRKAPDHMLGHPAQYLKELTKEQKQAIFRGGLGEIVERHLACRGDRDKVRFLLTKVLSDFAPETSCLKKSASGSSHGI